MNSVLGAFLLSFFLLFFIVVFKRKMNGMERMLNSGFGYFVLVMLLHGFPIGFITGLFPCLLISLSVLYFGLELIKIWE